MSTTTPNFGFILPGVNDPADQDQWGTQLNENFTNLDNYLKDASGFSTEVKTTTYGVVEADANKMLLCDATSAAFTVNLLPAVTAGDGFIIVIKKTDAGGNAITIDANAGELIDLATTYVLASAGDAAYLVCDGTGWQIAAIKLGSPSGVPAATTSTQGIIQLATNAEAIAGVDSAKAIVPSSLLAAMAPYVAAQLAASSNPVVTAGTTGKIVMGAVTIQWGKVSTINTSQSTTFGSAFGGTPYFICTQSDNGASPTPYVSSVSATAFTWTKNTGTSFWYLAIGAS